MQNIVVRDLLKILIDKSQTLKGVLIDQNKMKKVYLNFPNVRPNFLHYSIDFPFCLKLSTILLKQKA